VLGLDRDLFDYIDGCVADALGGLGGRAMLELGNQHVYSSEIPERAGKQYYEARGVDHTSFDLNGKDGAESVDLSKPCDGARWRTRFDLITNSGTTEHVEPYNAQFECFRNIHDWLKPGGIAVHLVPDVKELDERGAWKDHCGNYYSRATATPCSTPASSTDSPVHACGKRATVPSRRIAPACWRRSPGAMGASAM
jgi:hypothetical protein